jgi:hypothetical protein
LVVPAIASQVSANIRILSCSRPALQSAGATASPPVGPDTLQ